MQATAGQVAAAGGNALCLPADATDAASIAQIVPAILDRFGRLDVLVHSLFPPHLFHRIIAMDESEIEQCRQLVEISTFGALLASYHAAKPMIAAGRGSMVFVTATSGLQSYPAVSSHAVGKAGIHALMQSLASELGDSGIRANAVAVGVITGETSKARPAYDDPQINADLDRAVDAGAARLAGTSRNATQPKRSGSWRPTHRPGPRDRYWPLTAEGSSIDG